MKAMTKEQFRRKYVDTHTELHALDYLRNGSVIKSSPGDRNISAMKPIPGKREIEKLSMEKHKENLVGFVMDANSVRAKEILDPEKLPYKDLLYAAIKLMPTKVEQSGSVDFTFGDMVKKAHLELEKVDTIEEGEVCDD